MTNEKSAGAGRRSRRLVLNSVALLTIGVALLITIGRSDADNDVDSWSEMDQEFTRTDAEIAAHLLQSIAGVNDVVCAAIDRAFSSGYWGASQLVTPDATLSKEAAETARWIGKRQIDKAVLEAVRPGLASGDACTRRIAARIAGHVAVDRLDEELRSELDAAAAATRMAAVLALGYAEQSASLPRLQHMLDDADHAIRLAAIWALGAIENSDALSALTPLLNDRDNSIRLHAVWALGRIEDATPSDEVVRVLHSDTDPEVRRAAAWALGQMHD
jgi:HEAT repeat protein